MPSPPYQSVSWLIALSLFGTGLIPMSNARGQIAADDTLRVPSVVTNSGSGSVITGGTRSGNHLFHSFSEFSVPTNGSAFFLNDVDVDVIFSRVTGNTISEIDGFLGSRGTADLFFINPRGIIFGENASLNIGGSFIASSASSIDFADGVEFRADNPQANSLLTVSTPIGLQFGADPGEIQNRGAGFDVPQGETLALIANGLTFTGGTIAAEDGRIELGSVAANQVIRLNALDPGWEFSYTDVNSFDDIRLAAAATVDAGGAAGGTIQVYGRNLTLQDGSQIVTVGSADTDIGTIEIFITDIVDISGVAQGNQPSGIFVEVQEQASGANSRLLIDTSELRLRNQGTISTNTQGARQGADLDIRASERITIQGNPSLSAGSTGLFAQTEQRGNGGTIMLSTPQLLLEDGARISTTTFDSGNAGSIAIDAERIVLQGTGVQANGRSIVSAIAATTENSVRGNGGNITIVTDAMTLRDGAQIITSTRGEGRGGTLRVTAAESITLNGAAPDATDTIRRSGLFVASERQGTGDVGNLVLRSPLLRVVDRAEISANTFRGGEAGRIQIDVDTLIAENGGQIRANSFRNGEGGEISITASDRILLTGTGTIRNRIIASGIASRVPRRQASADAGAINIRGDRIDVTDGAEIAVNSVGSGEAGDLSIDANQLRLNQGTLSASTQSGGGALINLSITDILILGQESNITARAFDQGNGGNITIDTPVGFIAALPDQDSNIIAQASAGRGGDINITAQSIFNLQERPEVPVTNDIDASSEFGLDGSVTITRFETDPSRGAIALPTGLVDVSRLIAQNCGASGAIAQQRGEFVVTGQGGLSPAPGDVLSQAIWDDWRWDGAPSTETQDSATRLQHPDRRMSSPIPPPPQYEEMVEAQGWWHDADGNIHLLANAPTQQPSEYSQWLSNPQCQRT
ncbi:MAG: S-layer family protein [Cyanobacteria bacterium P01_E01_bin.6]